MCVSVVSSGLWLFVLLIQEVCAIQVVGLCGGQTGLEEPYFGSPEKPFVQRV